MRENLKHWKIVLLIYFHCDKCTRIGTSAEQVPKTGSVNGKGSASLMGWAVIKSRAVPKKSKHSPVLVPPCSIPHYSLPRAGVAQPSCPEQES